MNGPNVLFSLALVFFHLIKAMVIVDNNKKGVKRV